MFVTFCDGRDFSSRTKNMTYDSMLHIMFSRFVDAESF